MWRGKGGRNPSPHPFNQTPINQPPPPPPPGRSKRVLFVNLGSPPSPSFSPPPPFLLAFLFYPTVSRLKLAGPFLHCPFRHSPFAPEAIRSRLPKHLDTGRFAAGCHQPQCASEASAASQRPGGIGDALSKPIHPRGRAPARAKRCERPPAH